MQVEIFSICDFAQVYGGKLILSGPFDTIISSEIPVRQSCSIAIRLRVKRSEAGNCPFTLEIVDADGRAVVPRLNGHANISIGEGQMSGSMTLALRLENMTFPKFGDYSADLTVKGVELVSLPLSVVKRSPEPEQTNQ